MNRTNQSEKKSLNIYDDGNIPEIDLPKNKKSDNIKKTEPQHSFQNNITERGCHTK